MTGFFFKLTLDNKSVIIIIIIIIYNLHLITVYCYIYASIIRLWPLITTFVRRVDIEFVLKFLSSCSDVATLQDGRGR